MEEIGIQTDSFEQIVAGQKTIEGRLATKRFLTFKVGDEVSIREDVYEHGEIVASRPQAAHIVITDVQHFKTFREMLEQLGFKHFRPGDRNIEEALQTYRRYYSSDDERTYGVVGISFRLK